MTHRTSRQRRRTLSHILHESLESRRLFSVGPVNDLFASATAITATPVPGGNVVTATVTGSTVDATAEANEPSHAGFAAAHSVWWKWTAPNSGLATIDTVGSNFDTRMAVYTGSSVDSTTFVTSNDDGFKIAPASRVIFQAALGQTYYIAVDAPSDGGGSVTLNLKANLGGPANDNFAFATPVSSNGTLTANNFYATVEAGEPAHAGMISSHSVWWSWTPSADTHVVLDTFGSGFNTLLAVYTGPSVAGLTQVVANDQFNGGDESKVEFDANAGTTYYFAVDGSDGSTGNISLHLATDLGPTATLSAPDTNEGGSTSVTFSNQTGTGPFTYSYDFDNDGVFEITNSPNASAPVPSGYTADGNATRTVFARITDSTGLSTNIITTFHVNNVAPTATLSPVTVPEGSSANLVLSNLFDVPADIPGLKYSYDFNNDGTFDVVDSPLPVVAIPAGLLADGPFTTTLRARITDKDGGIADYNTTLTVTNVAPEIAIPAGSAQAAHVGQPFSLSAVVGDPGHDTVNSWHITWGDGSSSDSATPALLLTHEYAAPGNYTIGVSATDDDGTVSVSRALSVVNDAPTATLNSDAALSPDRSTVTFTVTYSDDVDIDTTTLGDSDLTVTGPGGAARSVRLLSSVATGDGHGRIATYAAESPDPNGGPWEFVDNGSWTVTLNSNAVTDSTSLPAAAGALGTFSVNLAAPDAPDLVPTVKAPKNLPLGASNTVNVSLSNKGTKPLNNTKITTRLYLSTDTVLDGSDKLLAKNAQKLTLGVNKKTTIPFTFNSPAVNSTGTYYLLVKTDATSKVAERIERNNIVSSKTKATTPFADLAVSFAPAPTTLAHGTNVPLKVKLANAGSAAYTGKVGVSLIFSTDDVLDSGDTTLLSSTLKLKTPLSAKSSATFNLSAPIPSTLTGTGHLFVVTTPAAKQDHNPANNSAHTPVSVT